MRQPPQRLLRQAVSAFSRYSQSEGLPSSIQEDFRAKAQVLADEVAEKMGAKDHNDRLVVWEELCRLSHRQKENRRLKSLGVEGY